MCIFRCIVCDIRRMLLLLLLLLLLSETGIRSCEKQVIHESWSSKSSLTFIAYH